MVHLSLLHPSRPIRLSLAALLGILLAQCSLAQIRVDRSILTFNAAEVPYQMVTVSNDNSFPVYLETEATEILSPGTEKEERILTSELLVSPRRFSIPPNSARSVRVLLRRQSAVKESVFRVRFFPHTKVPEEETLPEANTQKSSRLIVVTSIGILVLQRPLEVVSGVTFSRDGDTLVFSNEGNVSSQLFMGKQCLLGVGSESNCLELPSHRLYPDEVWRVKVEPGARIIYHEGSFENFRQLISDPESHVETVKE